VQEIVSGNAKPQRRKNHPNYDQRVNLWAFHRIESSKQLLRCTV
jgi:hypothetical protein